MEKHLQNFICYVEQGVFPEMLIALKLCQTGPDMQKWMESLGDYLSDFQRMKNFKPPEPKEALQQDKKVEVPIIEEIAMVEPQLVTAEEKKEEPLPPVEDSMQERVNKYIRLLDNELRVASYDEEALHQEQHDSLILFESKQRQMSKYQAESVEVHQLRQGMIRTMAAREHRMRTYQRLAVTTENQINQLMKQAHEELLSLEPVSNVECPANLVIESVPAPIVQKAPQAPPKTKFKIRNAIRMIGTLPQRKEQDFIFPPENKMSFNNPLVGFQHYHKSVFHGFNYIMKDGTRSDLQLRYNQGTGYQDVVQHPQLIVRKVTMYAGKGEGMISCIRFFDKEGDLILSAGCPTDCKVIKSFTLTEEERIVGVKSTLAGGLNSINSPRQYEVQFVIGWMEIID